MPHTIVFNCNIEDYSKKFVHNVIGKPKFWYDSIFERHHATAPRADFYVCGFPCGPFSSLGPGGGESAPEGMVYTEMVAYVKAQLPIGFVFENVPALLERFRDALQKLVHMVLEIVDGEGNALYNVYVTFLF